MKEMSFHFMHVAYVILSHLWLSCHSSWIAFCYIFRERKNERKEDIMMHTLSF